MQRVDDLFVRATFAWHRASPLTGVAGLSRRPQIARFSPFGCTALQGLGQPRLVIDEMSWRVVKALSVAIAVVAACSSIIGCTDDDDSRIRTGMSESDVHRMLGNPFLQTRHREVLEGHFLPADCLPRAMKADLYKRFMGAQFVVA